MKSGINYELGFPHITHCLQDFLLFHYKKNKQKKNNMQKMKINKK